MNARRLLDAAMDLIKVRDELTRTEDKLRHLRRFVDGSVNDIMDWMKEQNLITVTNANSGDEDSSSVEQSVVERGCAQGESSVGTDSEYEEWYPLQDGPGD